MSKVLFLCFVIATDICVSQVILPTLVRNGDSNRRPAESGSSPPSFPLPKPSRNRPTTNDNVDHVGEESRNIPAEPYNFAYNVKDEYGNTQYRKEEGDGKGTVRGTYGYTDAKGLFRFVEYVADAFGFRANIRSNEPGISNAPAADITLLAEDSPRGIYETAASNPKPVAAETSENRDRDRDRDDRSRVRVPKNVYAILGNKPAASGRIQYVVAAPVTTPTTTTTTDASTPNLERI